jgi:hypothetical protein
VRFFAIESVFGENFGEKAFWEEKKLKIGFF